MKDPVRVRSDGRLTLPKKFVEKKGLSPREYVDLKDVQLGKEGRAKRAFLRFARDGAWALLAAAAVEILKPVLKNTASDPDIDQNLLERLFGMAQSGSGALVAAADHPFKKPPAHGEWYPTEGRNCASYKARFLKDYVLRQVTHDPDIKPTDGLILFGSQVSNYKTRQYFGNWLHNEPHFWIAGRDWRVKLRWNLYTPLSAPEIYRTQFGGDWKTRSHRLGSSQGDEYESIVKGGCLQDDYLLVTALPRSSKNNQRIIVFAGLHGPGQQGTDILLGAPPQQQLKALEKEIAGEPYYQALFYVPLQKGDDDELHPERIQLIEAMSLKPRFA